MTSNVLMALAMICTAHLTAKATVAIILGIFLLSPRCGLAQTQNQLPKRDAAAIRAERKALRFGRRLQSLSQSKNKKNATLIQKKTKSLVLISQKVPFRLVPIQNLIERGQMLMQALPAALPVRGRISSSFGPRRHPRNQDFRLHAGIDIVARFGSPVVATADGRVVFSGEREGYGKVIVLDHGFGYQTVYAHNSRLSVPMGVRVARGQVISHVGKSGHTTGTHLHYEVRKNGVPIDPRPYLKKQMPPSS